MGWSIDLDPVTGEWRIIDTAGVVALITPRADEHENAEKIAAVDGLVNALQVSRANVASLGPAGALAHVFTPYRDWLAAIDAALAAVPKADLPGVYFANLLGHEWIGPDGIRYAPSRLPLSADVAF